MSDDITDECICSIRDCLSQQSKRPILGFEIFALNGILPTCHNKNFFRKNKIVLSNNVKADVICKERTKKFFL